MNIEWTRGLNEEQKLAVMHDKGPLLILAGAGSGKTTVLVSRAGRIISEQIARPEQLCVLTFTNKAARELKHRVQSKIGPRASKIWAGTFHSFGLMLLRKYHGEAGLSERFGILDATDAGHIAKEILGDFNQGGKTGYDAEKLLSTLSRMRESGNTKALNDDEYEVGCEWLLPRYLRRLESLGMIDFDGLILKTVQIMDQNPSIKEAVQRTFTHVMVDEFQDTNRMQMDLIARLVQQHRNIAVVGDDDQSIYGWRGALVKNILDFPKVYSPCEVVRLETNYRSTTQILTLANAAISKNTERHAKVLRPSHAEAVGQLPEVYSYDTEDEEAEMVVNEIENKLKSGYKPQDIAVIYRSNGQGALFEAELRKRGVAYSISGGTAFFDRKETRDILAYLRCSFHPNEIALRRILNTPPRGIGEKTVEALTVSAHQRDIPFVKAVREWHEAGIEAKAGESIAELLAALDGLIPFLVESPSPGAALLDFFTRLGYRKYLEKFSGNQLAATKRWRYLEIFSEILERFVSRAGKAPAAIRDFTDSMELRDLLENKEDDKETIQLLTLHACKGLEWPVVFLAGIEEDILPHKRLGTDIAEERRLFYVGVTRAKEQLYLSRARKRRKNGRLADSAPSRFLMEIPSTLYTAHDGPRPITTEKRKSMLAELFNKLDKLDAAQ